MDDWRPLYWQHIFECRCEGAIGKKIASFRGRNILPRETVTSNFFDWLEKESGMEIRGETLTVDQYHKLINILHDKRLV